MAAAWSHWFKSWKGRRTAVRRNARPTCLALEERTTPASFAGGVNVAYGPAGLVAGAGPGGLPLIAVHDPVTGAIRSSFLAFDARFTGGVNVATGSDGSIVAGAGAGGAPVVSVFDSFGNLAGSFTALDKNYSGGVNVATADVNGDGRLEIIVAGAGPGIAPTVRIFNSRTFDLVNEFNAFFPAFRGGVSVTAADLTGDGRAEVIVGAGSGGVPLVRVFNATNGQVINEFMAFDRRFSGGVTVAASAAAGGQIMVGAGPGGVPMVSVFNETGGLLRQFVALDPRYTGGTLVAAGDVNADGIIDTIVGADTGGLPAVQVNNGMTNTTLSVYMAFENNNATPTPTPTPAPTPTPTPTPGDTTRPTIQITGPAQDQTLPSNPTITGTAADNVGVIRVEAQVDNSGAFQAVTFANGAFSFRPSVTVDGLHSIAFRAVDAAGNVSNLALFSYRLQSDAVAPTVTITSPTAGQTFTSNPTIIGTSSDNIDVVGVDVRVDGGAFVPAIFDATDNTFSFTTTLLTDGSANGQHTVEARARDASGNFSALASVTFTLDAVDTVSPTVAITSPTANQSFATSVTVQGTATDNVGVATVEARLDNGSFVPANFLTANGTFTFPTGLATDGSADGQHTVEIRATDAAGNVSTIASVTFTIDTTAPTLAITSPQPGQTFGQNPTIRGTIADNIRVSAVEASVDGGAFVPADFSANDGNFSFTTTLATDGSDDGAHTVVLRSRDAAGNVSASQSLTFTLDTINTLTVALDAASDTGTPGNNITELATVTLVGVTDPGATVTLVGGTVTTTANANGNYSLANVPLNGGSNVLTVRATSTGTATRDAMVTVIRNAAPTVAAAPGNVTIAQTGAITLLNLPQIFSDEDVNSLVRFNTNFGAFDVELFDQQVGITTQNFLSYALGSGIAGGSYDNTIIHRTTRVATDGIGVLQGGGYRFTQGSNSIPHIPTNAQIQLQAGLSNVNGTLAMARTSAANSATSEFFINTADNTALNAGGFDPNGYAVFGVIRSGRAVVDAMYAVPEQIRTSPFGEIPLQNYPQPPAGNFPSDLTASNLLLVNSVSVVRQSSAANADSLTFSIVTNSDPNRVTASIEGGTLRLSSTSAVGGSSTIILRATDRNGVSVETTIRVFVS